MVAALPFIAMGLQAGGALFSGIAKSQADNYQAAVARNNAITARQNATYSAQAGAADIERAGLKARAEGANVRAGFAANNLDVGTGSADVVQQSQRALGRFDTATVGSRAAERVYGYQTEATSFQAESNLDRAKAKNDLFSGVLSAAGDIVGGAADLPSGAGGVSPISESTSQPFENVTAGNFEPAQPLEPLLSGPPSVPSTYSFMQEENPAGVEDLGLG